MKKRISHKSGFSLVEVTVALGVIVFCLVTVMGLLAMGVNLTHVSTVQTSATNILTAVVADVESTPNPAPRGSAQTSLVYKITLPAAGTAVSANPTVIWIGEDGSLASSSASALYRLNVWTTGPTATNQETLVRLLLTWPAATTYDKSQGSLESIIAINRT